MMKLATCCVLAAVAAAALVAHNAAATLSFASIGDWGCVPIGGWHKEDQLIVAKQFAKAAAEIDAQFVLSLADNFYYCGINKQNANWWNTTFENVFSEDSMMVPWISCLGNHDYGYPDSVPMQIAYKSPNKNRWVLPARYFYRRIEFPGQVNISVVVLDATPCMSDYRSNDPSGWDPCGSVIPGCPGCTFHENVIAQNCTAQLAWLQNEVIPNIPQGDWKIVMNHAPANDVDVEDFTSVLQAAQFDMYINGHVHLMAHYQMDNKGTYITTGGGCMVRVPDTDRVPETAGDKLYDNLGKVKAAAERHRGGAGKKLSHDEAKKVQQPPGDILQALRKDKRASNLGATSCTEGNGQHTCQLVYQKTVAGYTTHTFSEDFQTLYTYIYNWEGQLLHSLSTKKGTGGEPGSSGSGGPAPSGSHGSSSSTDSSASSNINGCCYYDSPHNCPAGQTCCAESGKSYDQYDCSKYGAKHSCKWDSFDNKCVVN